MKAIVDFSPGFCPKCGTAVDSKGSQKAWVCDQCGLRIHLQDPLSFSKLKDLIVSGCKKTITGGGRLLRKIPSRLAIGLIGVAVLLFVLAFPDLIMSGNPLIGLIVFLIGLLVIFIFPSRQP